MTRARLTMLVVVAAVVLVAPNQAMAQDPPPTTSETTTTSTTVPPSESSTTSSTVEPTTSLPFATTIPPPVVLPEGPVDGSAADPEGTPAFEVPTSPEANTPRPRGIPKGLAAALARIAPLERRLTTATNRLGLAQLAVASSQAELDAANAEVTTSQSVVDQLSSIDRSVATSASRSRARMLDTTVAAFIAGGGTNEIAAMAMDGHRPENQIRLTYFDSILDRLRSDSEHWTNERRQLDSQLAPVAEAHARSMARVQSATTALADAVASVGAAQSEIDAAKAALDAANSGVWADAPVVAGIPDRVMDVYVRAAQLTAVNEPSCRIGWWALAAIGQTESRHAAGRAIAVDGTITPPIFGPVLDGSGGFARITDTDGGRLDGDPVLDRAMGPTQFIPGTWRALGVDASGDGFADPQNIYDATYSSARYLCASARPLTMDTEAGFKKAAHSYSGSATYPAISWDWSAPYRAIAAATG